MLTSKKPKATRLCRSCQRRFVPEDARRIEQECPYCHAITSRTQTISQLKKRAWKLLSRLVRYGAMDGDGLVRCVTCGRRRPPEGMDAGHYMSRSFGATFLDEQNVWPQCKECNSGYGRPKFLAPNESVKSRYSAFLDSTLGSGAAEAVYRKALAGRGSWRVGELQDIIAEYQRRLAVLGLPGD